MVGSSLPVSFIKPVYQVVRKELFVHLRDPAIVIREDSITFNTAYLRLYGALWFMNNALEVLHLNRGSSSVFVSMFGQMAVIQMDDGTKPE